MSMLRKLHAPWCRSILAMGALLLVQAVDPARPTDDGVVPDVSTVFYHRLYERNEPVSLFRGQAAELDIIGNGLQTMSAVELKSMAGSAVPAASAEVVFATGNRARVRVTTSDATPLGLIEIRLRFPIELAGPGKIRANLTQVGVAHTIRATPEHPKLGENVTIEVTGLALENATVCDAAIERFLVDAVESARSPVGFQIRGRVTRTGRLRIGTESLRDVSLRDWETRGHGCPGTFVPFGPVGSPPVDVYLRPNPRPSEVQPDRVQPGDWVRIEGQGLSEQVDGYDISVMYRADRLPPTHPHAVGGPVPAQRAAGDAIEFAVPSQMRDSRLELVYTGSEPGSSVRVDVPGVVLVDRLPIIEAISGQNAQGYFTAGSVIEVTGSDLWDRDALETRVFIGDERVEPQPPSPGGAADGTLRIPVSGGGSSTGRVAVEHGGGRGVSRESVTVVGRPRIASVHGRPSSIIRCVGGAPRIFEAGDFGGSFSVLKRGFEYLVRGTGISAPSGGVSRLSVDGVEQSIVEVSADELRFTLALPASGATPSPLRIETPGGSDEKQIVIEEPTMPREVLELQVVHGSPPVRADTLLVSPTTGGGSDPEVRVLEPGEQGCGIEFVPFTVLSSLGNVADVRREGDRFMVRLRPVDRPTTVILRTVGALEERTVPVVVAPQPADPRSVAFEYDGIVGGNEAEVRIDVVSPSTIGVLEVTSSHPSVLPVPATVAATAPSITFRARTPRVDAPETVTVTVTGATTSASATLRVGPEPIRMQSLTVEPANALGGAVLRGTVRMTGMTDQTQPIEVALEAAPREIEVPATVRVSGGVGTFEVRTRAVEGIVRASVVARSAQGEASASFTLTPMTATAVVEGRTPVPAGATVNVTVRLNGAAPADVELQVTASDPQALTVGAVPMIKQGQTTVQFPVTVDKSAAAATHSLEILLPGQQPGAGITVGLPVG